MRRRIALIDAPDVSEPTADVTVSGIVAEEPHVRRLRASHPLAVSRMLRELNASEWARYAIGTVPPTVRIRLLAELALLRKGADGLSCVVASTATAATLSSGGGSPESSQVAASRCSSWRGTPPPRPHRRLPGFAAHGRDRTSDLRRRPRPG
ncbi:hypothetical protein ACRAWC_20475 [Leifsonia sp. L25]|uniref:hypothetical protein n=1 Tax=Leifsonia sp. L25 TaxID=3423957 RepID=UPI003D6991E6